MLTLRSSILAVLLASTPLAALPATAWAQTCTCGTVGVRAEEPPPPLPVYDQPPLPSPGYMWTPGYWYWNNVDYYWVPGTWVEPPHEGLLWTPGYWGYSDGVYLFNRGYWGPHVGFYGGVSYGFGYGGSGYQGGRWNGGVFAYNRTVNNFGGTHITNVYEERVVENGPPNRASFNGGEGGIAAKPTPEEEAASKEPHDKPTALQVEHTRAASVNAGSFASTNHGKPLVAATARPGKLTGPGVVKAKAVSTAADTKSDEPAAKDKERKKTPDASDATKPAKTLDEKPAKATDEKPLKTLDEKPVKAKEEKPVKAKEEKPVKTLDEKPAKAKDERPADIKPKRENPPPAKVMEERPRPRPEPVKAAAPRPAPERKPEKQCGRPGEPKC